MRFVFSKAAALAALLTLAACAEPAIPYDRGSGAAIQSIGILTPRLSETPQVTLTSNLGQSFGLTGVLLEAAMQQARSSRLQSILKERQYVGSDRFDKYLEEAVAQEGYKVVSVPLARKTYDYVTDFGPLAPADAWLDCVGVD